MEGNRSREMGTGAWEREQIRGKGAGSIEWEPYEGIEADQWNGSGLREWNLDEKMGARMRRREPGRGQRPDQSASNDSTSS